MRYMNIETGEIFSEEEVRKLYEQFSWEDDLRKYNDFSEYLDHMLELGRNRQGGLVEI